MALKDSYRDNNHMRLEIAILQEKVKSYIPGYAKFKIPTLTENSDEIIEIYLPMEYTYFWGDQWVPEGTRFIVAMISANINDLKIIGRYDDNKDFPVPSHSLAQYIIQLILLKQREQNIFDFGYDNDKRITCHHASRAVYGNVGDMVPNNYPQLDYELWEGPDYTDKASFVRGIKV